MYSNLHQHPEEHLAYGYALSHNGDMACSWPGGRTTVINMY
ncbi:MULTISPECIES: hypothetical protein [Pantoea]|nr:MULTISPECIES: hypothetical protein [Pantoea]